MLPAIEPREFDARVARTREGMQAAGIDALLVTSEANFRWLTGFRSQSWVSPTRPRYLILPLAGEPVVVSPAGSRIAMRETSWIRDVRVWVAPCPADDGISLTLDALRAAKAKRVGAELGPETRLGFPVADFDRLRAQLAPATVVDAGRLLAEARMIKSPAEIARIRFAARTAAEGFVRLARAMKPGDSERDACRWLQIDLLQHGLDRSPYMIGASGPDGYETINTDPSDRRLNKGDLFIIDTGSQCDGYFCDIDRNFAIGTLSTLVRDVHRRVWESTEAGFAATRPGARMSDVWRAMAEVLGGAEAAAKSNVGRMGHGLGSNLTEQPSVHPEDHTVLAAGMVITLEPGIGYQAPDGRRCVMVHEENVLVTASGAEMLSLRAPADPFLVE